MKNILLTWFEILLQKLCWGFVAFKFYYWFFKLIVTDAPNLSYLNVLGIMFVIFAFSPQVVVMNIIPSEEEVNYRFTLLLQPLLVLFFGYLLTFFI
jgi:hypothetical protein